MIFKQSVLSLEFLVDSLEFLVDSLEFLVDSLEFLVDSFELDHATLKFYPCGKFLYFKRG